MAANNLDTNHYTPIAQLVSNTRDHPENLAIIENMLIDNPDLVNTTIHIPNRYDDLSLLMIACMSNTSTYDTVELLLKYNADIYYHDNEHNTALFYALNNIENPNDAIDMLELLLYYGADINKLDVDGFSILQLLLINKCDYEIIKYILEHTDVDVHVINCRNLTALDYAQDYPDILELIKNKIESDLDTSLDVKSALE